MSWRRRAGGAWSTGPGDAKDVVRAVPAQVTIWRGEEPQPKAPRQEGMQRGAGGLEVNESPTLPEANLGERPRHGFARKVPRGEGGQTGRVTPDDDVGAIKGVRRVFLGVEPVGVPLRFTKEYPWGGAHGSLAWRREPPELPTLKQSQGRQYRLVVEIAECRGMGNENVLGQKGGVVVCCARVRRLAVCKSSAGSSGGRRTSSGGIPFRADGQGSACLFQAVRYALSGGSSVSASCGSRSIQKGEPGVIAGSQGPVSSGWRVVTRTSFHPFFTSLLGSGGGRRAVRARAGGGLGAGMRAGSRTAS